MAGEQARVAAGRFRDEARLVRECALALRRQHLVWWEGAAADEYGRRVRDRVAGLERTAAGLEAVGVLLDEVASLEAALASPTAPGRAGAVPT